MVKALRNGSPRLAWAVALCMGLSGWAVALVLAWKHDQRMGQVQAQVDDLRHRVMPLDLKRTMAWKQRYLDKTWHASQAEDWQAAGWYLRQVQRLSEGVAEARIENANGPVSRLEATMLLPRFEPAFQALEAPDRHLFVRAYQDIVATCNACHAATRHAYVRISVPSAGPGTWNQTFEPSRPDRAVHRPDPVR